MVLSLDLDFRSKSYNSEFIEDNSSEIIFFKLLLDYTIYLNTIKF